MESAHDQPCYMHDILEEIFSHLAPADAARAALVCTIWHRNAVRPSYSHIILRVWSPSAALLSRTLSTCPQLRHHVKRLTIVSCDIKSRHDQNLSWIHMVPPGSIVSYRGIGPVAINSLSYPALADAADVEVAILTLLEHEQGPVVLRPVAACQSHFDTADLTASLPSIVAHFFDFCACNSSDAPDDDLQPAYLVARWSHVKSFAREDVEEYVRPLRSFLAFANIIACLALHNPSWLCQNLAKFFNRDADTDFSRRAELSHCLCHLPSSFDIQPPCTPGSGLLAVYGTQLTADAALRFVRSFWEFTIQPGDSTQGFWLFALKDDAEDVDTPCDSCGAGICFALEL